MALHFESVVSNKIYVNVTSSHEPFKKTVVLLWEARWQTYVRCLATASPAQTNATKVIREKSRGEGPLIVQDTIENMSEPNFFFNFLRKKKYIF